MLIEATKLPAPRLELHWHKTGDTWETRECAYGLVLPLQEHDIRRENADGSEVSERFVEISRTNCSGGTRWLFTEADENGKPHIDTPFRDSAHAKWDSEALCGLPIFVVFEGKALEVPNAMKLSRERKRVGSSASLGTEDGERRDD